MNLFRRMEQRLALPGDSETLRSQKTISTSLMFAGGILTVLNIILNLSLGNTTVSAIYAGWMIFILSTATLILWRPRLWQPVFSVAVVSVMPMVLFTHVYSGGFRSGLEAIVWMLQIPIAAALFVGSRFTIIALFVYVIGIGAAALMEPFAQSLAVEYALATRVQIASNNMILLGFMAGAAGLYLLRQVDYFRRRADNLLLNILPGPIALRLKEGSKTIADAYSEVTVLFADIVGSTPLFSQLDPAEAVDWLNEVFTMFDQLAEKYGLEKIRTIGDSYMVASGVPTPRDDHAQAMARFALELIDQLEEMPARHHQRLSFRVGINSGPLVAGVIGRSKFQYDLWGDTVNVASRMESHGVPGKVQVTKATYELLKDDFDCISRGEVQIKGKGNMETWFVAGLKDRPPQASAIHSANGP
jgi:adenylate cyclase